MLDIFRSFKTSAWAYCTGRNRRLIRTQQNMAEQCHLEENLSKTSSDACLLNCKIMTLWSLRGCDLRGVDAYMKCRHGETCWVSNGPTNQQTNEIVLQEVGHPRGLLQEVQKAQMEYFGHIARRSADCLEKHNILDAFDWTQEISSQNSFSLHLIYSWRIALPLAWFARKSSLKGK